MDLHKRPDEDIKCPAEFEAVGGEQRFVVKDVVKDVLERDAEVLPRFVLRRNHVGGGVDEEGRTVERRGKSLLVGVGSMFDGAPRDGGRCFEEAQDNVLALGEQRGVESLQGEGGEMVEFRLGEGDVCRDLIGVLFVVQQL